MCTNERVQCWNVRDPVYRLLRGSKYVASSACLSSRPMSTQMRRARMCQQSTPGTSREGPAMAARPADGISTSGRGGYRGVVGPVRNFSGRRCLFSRGQSCCHRTVYSSPRFPLVRMSDTSVLVPSPPTNYRPPRRRCRRHPPRRRRP